MQYRDLKSKYEITEIMNLLRGQVPNLTRIILPSGYESTLRENKILTLYDSFTPVMKIEGTEELLGLFRQKLGKEQEDLKIRVS